MKRLPYQAIVVKALRNERFKSNLIEDPKRAIQRAFDVEIDDSVRIVVVQDSKELVHIVVPVKSGLRGEETGIVKRFLDEVRSSEKRLKQFQRQPHTVLNAALGYSIPKSMGLKVLVETPDFRVVHLPAVGSENISTAPEAEAFWGGGGGGDDDWTVVDGTYNSGQVCTCYTSDETKTVLPRCCEDGPGKTLDPGGLEYDMYSL